MATKNKWQRAPRTDGGATKPVADSQTPQKEAAASPEVPPVPSQKPTPPEISASIRKGVYLSALIYVEGDLAASADFTSPATSALKDALTEALKSNPGGLNMTLKKVDVQNDVTQDSAEESGSTEKFQF